PIWKERLDRDRGRAAETRVTMIDTRVDDRDTFVVSDERALHRVDREPLHVGKRERERAGETLELLGKRHVGHEPVVGIHGDAEALREEMADGMFGEGRYSPGIHVRRRAQFERDALVAHV